MYLSEVDQAINYTTEYIRNPTKADTKEFVDHKMWVHGRSFERWFKNPQQELAPGVIITRAHAGDDLAGVGMIRLPAKLSVYELDDEKYAMFGQIGIHVKDDYRRQGIANAIATDLEKKLLSTFPEHTSDNVPVMLCARMACDIVKKVMKRVITQDDVHAILDRREKSLSNK